MKNLFAAASLALMAPIAQGATYTTCLTQGDQIGLATLPLAANEHSDIDTLKTQERDTFKYRLKSVKVCMHAQGRLANMVATSAKVYTDLQTPAEDVVLNIYGSQTANSNCETLNLNYAANEYLSKIESSWDNNASIRQVVLTSSNGNKISKGSTDGVTDVQSGSIEFATDKMPVGFSGAEGQNFFQKIGGITVPQDCIVGGTIPEQPTSNSSSDDGDSSSSSTTIIIVVVVAAVVLALFAMAIGGWCLYKKYTHNRDKKGAEVVSVSKTRPSTPPVKDTAKAADKNEPAVQVNTDEEENPHGADQNPDYKNAKSLSDKPDVNI